MKKIEKNMPLVTLTIKLSVEEMTALKKLSLVDGQSRNSIIRQFIQEGLSINAYQKDKDLIAVMLNDIVENNFKNYMERIIGLTAKSTISSASSLYLLADVLEKFVPENLRKNYAESLITARKKGVEYTQSRSK